MSYSPKSLAIRTFIVSTIMFALMAAWDYFDDPDPFDLGTVVFFLMIAAVSQAISIALYYSKLLLNTYPHILSNVISLFVAWITILIIIVY